jgi:1,2-diacylglycerol 3-alpha-glucosyltransferase/glucuronosyltransferase
VKLLIATDAWRPQVNGVVRTLEATIAEVARRGVTVETMTPDLFSTVPLPGYREIPLSLTTPAAVRRRIEGFGPDAVHIVTEGPLGWLVRRWCMTAGVRFASSYTTRFPEYVRARLPVPEAWSYSVLRRFHGAAAATLVATPRLVAELGERGFSNLRLWPRGVDTSLFAPDRAVATPLPRPVFVTASRVAVEKNIEAFLRLDLPGSKVVIGSGPSEAMLRRKYPQVHFLGRLQGVELAGAIASADVFVFPSRTDTFGVVQLEALACGVPVAAFPVPGPLDAVGDPNVGRLDEDLRAASLACLDLDRAACRAYAVTRSWERSADRYLAELSAIAEDSRASVARMPTEGVDQRDC